MKRADSLEMEIQITSMLEKVINDDSEDECQLENSKCVDFSFYNLNELKVSKETNASNNRIDEETNLDSLDSSSDSIEATNKNDSALKYSKIEDVLDQQILFTKIIDYDSHELMKGNYFQIISSKQGSKILQDALNNTKLELISQIFEEINPFIPELMTNLYANYFCQRIYSFLPLAKKLKFLSRVVDALTDIGNHKIGTHSLQVLIDNLSSELEKKILINSFKGKMLVMAINSNGCRVIERIINNLTHDTKLKYLLNQLIEEILNYFVLLANDVNGLCVIKQLIIYAQDLQIISSLSCIISENCFNLVYSPFGNYAIQIALEYWPFKISYHIIHNLSVNFFDLSLLKYSSNVVEKCLETNEQIVLPIFINEICKKQVTELMNSPYGNYVVQKALKISSRYNKILLTNLMKQNLKGLKDRKIISKWNIILDYHITQLNTTINNCTSVSRNTFTNGVI